MGRQEDAVKTMAIALLNWADDEGYFYADPSSIRSFARPFDDASTMTLRCLEQLMKIEYISIRLHESRGYIGKVTNFLEHQRIDRPKPSVIKRFYDEAIPTINLRSIDDSSTIDRAGKEGNVKEEETKPSARKARGVNNSQVAKAAGQTRHSRLQGMIARWYEEWAGTECPWGGGEGRNLKRMLDSTPNWPDQQFVTCLVNLAASDCIPKGERPLEWLEKLPKFLHGPLDRFWKPIGSNGNGRRIEQAAGTSAAVAAGVDKFLRRKNAMGPQDVPGTTPAQPGEPS